MQPVTVFGGDGPLVLGVPHAGTWLPNEIGQRLNANGKILADTDWHIDRLYQGLLPGITMVKANFHRYCIDANRDPAGSSLYPGQNTTQLVPLTDFDGLPIWQEGKELDAAESAARIVAFHAPYHAALKAELTRVKASHGFAILYDCHSIRSRIPFLFEGVLPDFNIGTNDGVSCDAGIAAIANAACAASGFTHVSNGRFKGGWTTRHYGRRGSGVHAIQMELAQSTHLVSEVTPFEYDAEKAERLRRVLSRLLAALAGWSKDHA